MRAEPLFTAARWLFGTFYAATGVWVALGQFGLATPPPQPTDEAEAFMSALAASRFVEPLLALTFLMGGAALLWRRTAALGIALLAPPVVVIFGFHLALTGQILWGALNLTGLAALAWRFRSAFVPLIGRTSSLAPGKG